MIIILLTLVPPIISVGLFVNKRKKEQPKIQIFTLYSMFVLIVNIVCFFFVWVLFGGRAFVLSPENIVVSWAFKYLLMSSCVSVAAPFGVKYLLKGFNYFKRNYLKSETSKDERNWME